jgi:hypothetical protein
MTAKAIETMRPRVFAAGTARVTVTFGALATATATVLTLVMATTTPANAEDNNKVDVHLKGSVRPTCEVAGRRSSVTTPVNVGNVNTPGSTAIDYPVNCNAPFAYEISSRYGGLQRRRLINGERPKRIYNVNVNIPTDIGAINDTCASDTIKAGSVTCALSDSGDGVALDQQAHLTVSWDGTPQLPGGKYTDRLTFTVRLQQ